MNNNEEIKYYTRSNGEKILMSEVQFDHLSNGLAKRLREVFNSPNKDTFYNNLKDIKDIQEEIYKRINDFGTKFEEKESNDVNG